MSPISPRTTARPRIRPTVRAAAALSAVVLSLGLSACGSDSGVRTVSAGDAVAAAQQEGVVVLDVRTPAEFASGHLNGARNMPLGKSFENEVGKLDKSGRYVLYCQSGNRSAQAAKIMSKLGFSDVQDGGGLAAMAKAGGAIVTS